MIARASGIVAALLAGCSGEVGTIAISLVTAPGSTVLDPVTTLRATLTSPLRVVEAPRGPGGFDLELEVDADGRGAVVLLEGFDAAGQVIAVGASPPLPLVALDADIRIYLAAPQSLAAAPVTLDPPRTELATAVLPYGVLIAGGSTTGGAPTADLDIYSAYDHEMAAGLDLPSPRRGMALGLSTNGYAYLFGGADVAGTPSGLAWRFDTDAQPAGSYVDLDDEPTLARVGEVAAPLGFEQFLITGEPPALLNGFTGVMPVTSVVRLPPVAVSVQAPTLDAPVFTVIIGTTAGSSGVVELRDGVFTDRSAPPDALRTGHGAVPTPEGAVVAIGGSTIADGPIRSAIKVDPLLATVLAFPDVLVTPRNDAAIATNGEVLVVAGGTDGAGVVLGDAELIDLATMTPIATIPMVVPRTGASARPLANGQIMILGGVDAAGMPVGTIELFTPLIVP